MYLALRAALAATLLLPARRQVLPRNLVLCDVLVERFPRSIRFRPGQVNGEPVATSPRR